MRDARDDGNALAGVVVALAILVVGIAAAYVGSNIGDWL